MTLIKQIYCLDTLEIKSYHNSFLGRWKLLKYSNIPWMAKIKLAKFHLKIFWGIWVMEESYYIMVESVPAPAQVKYGWPCSGWAIYTSNYMVCRAITDHMPEENLNDLLIARGFTRGLLQNCTKSPLIRNPLLEISLFCLLYKGDISRNSLKSFLNQYIQTFHKTFPIFVSGYSVILYSISAVSRHTCPSSQHFICTMSAQLPLKFRLLPYMIITNSLHFRRTEVVMRY